MYPRPSNNRPCDSCATPGDSLMETPSATTTDPSVLYLLAEKERLLDEKDELINSKDTLWRKYYDIIREKDTEIEQLRKEKRNLMTENERIKEKAQDLAEALEELIEKDTVGEENNEADEEGLDSECRSKLDNDSGMLWDISDDWKPGGAAITGDPLCSFLGGPGFDRHPPGSQLIAPTHESAPPKTKLLPLVQPDFIFEPLVNPTRDGSAIVGAFHKLAQEVRDSIKETVDEIARRHANDKLAAHPKTLISSCAHMWTVDASSKIRWTVESPGRFTCYTCFNKRKACLVWKGDMKWLVLPLPRPLQPETCTYTDKEYYIYPGGENAIGFPGVWEESKKRKRKPTETGWR